MDTGLAIHPEIMTPCPWNASSCPHAECSGPV